jgi:carbon monoxide dehydrogenase subunit G
MRLEGSVQIKTSRKKAWQLLTDAEAVSKCMPGVDSLEIVEPGRKFRAVGALGLGTVKVKFTNDVEWVELEPPERAKMKIRGTAPGSSMDTTSEMFLTDGADGTTEMKWTAEVVVMGTIASLAMRLMGSVSKKLTNDFFTCIKKRLER